MDYLIICVTAGLGVGRDNCFPDSDLERFSAAFALFFPVPVAIAATPIVHLANICSNLRSWAGARIGISR